MKSCNVPYFLVILVACVSSAVSSLVFPFYDEPFPSIVECISKSGNQDICDQFQFCGQIKAAPYLEAYYKCVNEYLPRGIGKCSGKEELYYNREMRIKYVVQSSGREGKKIEIPLDDIISRSFQIVDRCVADSTVVLETSVLL
ncbi:hypothetical protein CEXT_434691 [Caerostris extrusa]|uniref:Uncharacterized protein n=1 Tax=Caerostris extrusa TaxID=172846 RepID=A0AAV4QF51_CAEEX|nr:hypothetical protein CEXT_434691 [Caerostris extrusa]